MNGRTSRVNPPAPARELNQEPARLKRRRIVAGLKLRQAAEEAGCSAGYLSDLENGNYSAGVEILGRLAEVYGCESVEELMPPLPAAVIVPASQQGRAVA